MARAECLGGDVTSFICQEASMPRHQRYILIFLLAAFLLISFRGNATGQPHSAARFNLIIYLLIPARAGNDGGDGAPVGR